MNYLRVGRDMGRMGKFDCEGMKEFKKQLEQLMQTQNEFVESCAKELAARLLRLVVKKTPVGVYPESTGKMGGTLRRGWTIGEIRKEGGVYKIEIINQVEYASYVEHGHRTANHKGWVKGRFMMTISEQELEKIAPKVLENKIKKYLEGCMK